MRYRSLNRIWFSLLAALIGVVAAFGSVSFVFLPPLPASALFLVMSVAAGVLTFWLPRATVGGREPMSS